MSFCACILHNLWIDHSVLQDWLDGNDLELDEEDESNQPTDSNYEDKRHVKYLTMCWKYAKVVIDLKCSFIHVELVTHYLYCLEIFLLSEVGISDLISIL